MPKTPQSQKNEGQKGTSYKVCFLGDSEAGKTSVMNRMFIGENFVLLSKYLQTIGVNFVTKTINKTSLQIWDISGDELPGHMLRVYYKETNCFVPCWDLSKDFNNQKDIFEKWLDTISQNFADEFALVVIGTKRDLAPDLDEEEFKNAIKEIIKNHPISKNSKIKFNPAKNIVITSAKNPNDPGCEELPKVIIEAINPPQEKALPQRELPPWAKILRSEIARFEFSSWGKNKLEVKSSEQSDPKSKTVTKTIESVWKDLSNYSNPQNIAQTNYESIQEALLKQGESSLLTGIKTTFQKTLNSRFSFSRADSSRIFYKAWSDPKSAALAKKTLEKIINTFNFMEEDIDSTSLFKNRVRMQIGNDAKPTNHILPNNATDIVNLYLQAKHYEITWQDAIKKITAILHKTYCADIDKRPYNRSENTQNIYNNAFDTLHTDYYHNLERYDDAANGPNKIQDLRKKIEIDTKANQLAEILGAEKDKTQKESLLRAAWYHQFYQEFPAFSLETKRKFRAWFSENIEYLKSNFTYVNNLLLNDQKKLAQEILPPWATTLYNEINRFHFSSSGKNYINLQTSNKVTKTIENVWMKLCDYNGKSQLLTEVKNCFQNTVNSFSALQDKLFTRLFFSTRADSSRVFYQAWSDPISAALAKETLEKIINTFNFDEKEIHGPNFFKYKVNMKIGVDAKISQHMLPKNAFEIFNLYKHAAQYKITWQEAINKATAILNTTYCADISKKPSKRSENTQNIYNRAFNTISDFNKRKQGAEMPQNPAQIPEIS